MKSYFFILICLFSINISSKALSECENVVSNIQALKICAEKGDAISQYNLGISYRDGNNIEQNFKNAFYWLNQAEMKGLLEAKFGLAWFYERGIGVAQDKNRAFKYINDLANQNYPLAVNNLGRYYQKGIGVEKNLEKAVSLYRKAIDLGAPSIAYINLSYAYFYGLGVPKDVKKAILLIEKLAENGDRLAMTNLGKFYKELGEYKKAFQWTEIGAINGDSLAQANLGFQYSNGIGVSIDREKALYWLNESIKQNQPQAFFIMGTLYAEKSTIVEQNDKKAFEFYSQAARMGNGNAQNNLGTWLLNGRYVAKNEKEALKWYLKAANENDIPEAMYALSQIYAKGTKSIPKSTEQAQYWLNKAKEYGFNQ